MFDILDRTDSTVETNNQQVAILAAVHMNANVGVRAFYIHRGTLRSYAQLQGTYISKLLRYHTTGRVHSLLFLSEVKTLPRTATSIWVTVHFSSR